ncbi:uncharacterized protein LOC123672114 [Harmonia axyridis]|uniref:uncharacterized protein LOC123672114 n=1 Tax=Harmonia axyridis TaxID=115357 RepID=UPI001E275E2A|nr:uncharacterized protein LOC123672114 [Harmonia axyridis]
MVFQMSGATVWLLFFVLSFGFVSAEEGCYGAGFVSTSVVLAVFITLCVVGAVYYWFRRRPKTEHLILETDPEKGKTEYAFDNPGFKDATLAKSHEKSPTKNELEREEKQKRSNWPNISAHTTKTEKKRAKDDCSPAEQEVKVISLKSHDFTGLGFNICGNMKEGIYVKDILHRGPASESGKLNTGDRIRSVTINFEHIVYEDALNILSFASPYEIKVEATGGKILFGSSSKSNHPSHPLYRSTSSIQLQEELNMSKKRSSIENSLDSNRLAFMKTSSNTTTLERKNSKSPRSTTKIQIDKSQNGPLNSAQLKNQLEQKNLSVEIEMREKIESPKMKIETQKTDYNHQKFGIKVFPSDIQTSRSTGETQNHKNSNTEKPKENSGFDEVDRKTEEGLQPTEHFNRNDYIYGSGLKRDENGIPQEIPSHMLNAAFAAKRNRKSQEDIFFEEDTKILKKIKNKAPSPPSNKRSKDHENMNFKEATIEIKHRVQVEDEKSEKNNSLRRDEVKKFSSDSDDDTDNQSSVNTVELNLSQITIHQVENDEKQNRKTASTGDLTKIHRIRKSSSGTLERAKSLDITDSGIPNLSQKIKGDADFYDVNSEEEFFGKTMIDKEPKLSLILDGLNTFQRNRLKKSTEWGNLEDAILRSNQDHENMSPVSERDLSIENFNLEEKSAEFNAVVNKINEIKNEPQEKAEVKNSSEVISTYRNEEILYEEQKPKNQLWPTETETCISIQPVNSIKVRTKSSNDSSPVIENTQKINIQNEIWPKELDNNYIDQSEKVQNVNEATNIISTEIEMLPINNNSRNEETIRHNKTNVVTTNEEVTTIKTNYSSFEEDMNPMSKDVTEFQKNIRDEPDPRMMNQDKIMVNNSSYIDKDMIVSETPPDAISELDIIDDSTKEVKNNEINTINVNLNTEQIQMSPIVSNKIKTHKRQQIPIEENEKLLPPKMDDSDLEKEMFELSDKTSLKVPERAITKVTADLVVPGSSLSHVEHNYKKQKSYLGFERNSETGELLIVNNTDESKTLNDTTSNYSNENESFIFNEKYLNSQDGSYNAIPGDINVSDDIKVSRHSFGSLERPKSDDAKSIESIKYSSNVSNVTVNNVNTENGTSSLHSLELSVNNNSSGDAMSLSLGENDLYTTALNNSLEIEREKNKISISTPDLIKNVSITEAINTLNGNMDEMKTFKESSKDDNARPMSPEIGDSEVHKSSVEHNMPTKHSSLTYITEIQVTPTSANKNISEIKIVPPTNSPSPRYSKNQISSYKEDYDFESLDTNKEVKNQIELKNRSETSKNIDPEENLHKTQEIVQEQFKKLPEMRFSTASYESPVEKVEKRQSQIELLKSNFERSPPKSLKTESTRSRIPVSTTMKTPPVSPGQKEESEKEILEILPSPIHSTPMTNTSKYQKSTNNKNVTITSIRTNSRIPSGLPVSGIRPPVPPKRHDSDNDSFSSTNSSISSFKQWVFNPVNSPSDYHNNK